MSEPSTTALVCPKCQGAMRSYERNSVTIDQCEQCRGVYLDRGELERLIDAEEQRYGTSPPPERDPYRDAPAYGYGSERGHGHGDSKHGSRYGGKRRRGGFLGELFD